MSGPAAGWHSYEDTSDLLAELDLNDADIARAREITEDHIRAWHLAQVRAGQDRTQSDLAASRASPPSNGASSTASPSPLCAPTSAPSVASFASSPTSAIGSIA